MKASSSIPRTGSEPNADKRPTGRVLKCLDDGRESTMCPVHVRAEPGDFANSVLLPGDPLRAKYIAETFFEDAKLVTEELIQLGAKNLLRVGTCGGYSKELRLGDLIVATSAAPQDGTVSSITRGVPYAPATLWGDLGVLGVEMEAAVIFAIAAMRGVRAGCLLTVSDTIGAEIIRISDEELRNAVDNMMALALDTLNALN